MVVKCFIFSSLASHGSEYGHKVQKGEQGSFGSYPFNFSDHETNYGTGSIKSRCFWHDRPEFLGLLYITLVHHTHESDFL